MLHSEVCNGLSLTPVPWHLATLKRHTSPACLPPFLPALGLFKWAPPLFFVWLILSHFIFSHLYSYILGRVFKSPSQGPLLCTSAAHSVAQVMA